MLYYIVRFNNIVQHNKLKHLTHQMPLIDLIQKHFASLKSNQIHSQTKQNKTKLQYEIIILISVMKTKCVH